MPAYYALILRSLTVLEGLALTADPQYKLLAKAYPYMARRLLTDPAPELRASFEDLILKVSAVAALHLVLVHWLLGLPPQECSQRSSRVSRRTLVIPKDLQSVQWVSPGKQYGKLWGRCYSKTGCVGMDMYMGSHMGRLSDVTGGVTTHWIPAQPVADKRKRRHLLLLASDLLPICEHHAQRSVLDAVHTVFCTELNAFCALSPHASACPRTGTSAGTGWRTSSGRGARAKTLTRHR